MDLTYRFRFLIYFAAFMLVMSVCFVYAEPMHSQQHLLFQETPQHSGFLNPANTSPSFDPAALRASSGPAISPEMLQQLESAVQSRHGLFHRNRRIVLRAAPANAQNQSTVLDLSTNPSTAAATR